MLRLRESATHLLVTGQRADLEAIDEWFRFQPDGYYFAPSYQRWRVSKGDEGWDGWLHPFQIQTRDAGRILRGHRFNLLSMLEGHAMPYNGDKLLPSPFAVDPQDVSSNLIEAPFELDTHQREGVAYWLNHAIGISRITVSGGKTAMFAAAAALLKEKFPDARILYVTQAERLVRQVTKEMKRFLPRLDIGQYGGGVTSGKEARDMCVCTIAVLHKHFTALRYGWFDTFMCLFYDEVHHCASPTSKRVVLEIPAYFRFGASDSTKSDDRRRNTEIHGLFGPVVVDMEAAPLIRKGRIARPYLYFVDEFSWNNKFKDVEQAPAPRSPAFVLIDGVWKKAIYCGHVYEVGEDGAIKTKLVKGTTKVKDADGKDTDEWEYTEQPVVATGLHLIEIDGTEMEVDARWALLERTYDKAIVGFRQRNERIVEWVEHFVKKGYPTLVVCTRTVHILILEALIGQAVGAKNVQMLFGDDGPAQRDETFEWFREGEGRVLITPLVKEGVSINAIRAGVIGDYIADWEVANQIIGRFIRKKDGDENFAEIVFFVDRQHPVLRRGTEQLLSRMKRFREYQVVVRNHPEDKLPPLRPSRPHRQVKLL
jgi:superfamily II DNA or RNA helicase